MDSDSIATTAVQDRPWAKGPATGSLFGLAYGDALGKPTEFMDMARIHSVYGPAGPRDLVGEPALVTDDTQMTLAVARAFAGGRLDDPQGLAADLAAEFVAWSTSPDNTRAPGGTCMSACRQLRSGQRWRDATMPRSKGCGANMRVAPAGLIVGLDDDTAAGIAQLQAAITHGHPTALAASDLTAHAIRLLADGRADLTNVVDALADRCDQQAGTYHEHWLGDVWRRTGAESASAYIAVGWAECATAIGRLRAALRDPDRSADPCAATGAGWIAEEALATGLSCAVMFADAPVDGLARAAASSGDSDSIACLAGAFLGAAHGRDAWPAPWAGRIEYAAGLAHHGQLWD